MMVAPKKRPDAHCITDCRPVVNRPCKLGALGRDHDNSERENLYRAMADPSIFHRYLFVRPHLMAHVFKFAMIVG